MATAELEMVGRQEKRYLALKVLAGVVLIAVIAAVVVVLGR
jgi:hypothetical protein